MGVWMMKKLMLCVLCLAFILSMLGCGSRADEELITLTMMPQYAPNITDEWLNANIGTYHQTFERLNDGSVVVNMTSEQYAAYLDSIRTDISFVAENMVANDHNNITDISFNDDFSEFRVTVKTDTLLRSDADSAYMLRSYGRFYHYLTTYQLLTSGLEAYLGDCSVVITFLNDDGNILEDNY